MPLQKIEPTVQVRKLGCLRMWQEDLAEIVRLVAQLPDVAVEIEADGYRLTDVAADLPGLGQRVGYFTVIARSRELVSDDGPIAYRKVVSVKLTKRGSHVEAADPDLTTLGLIERIETVAKARRRLSARLESMFETWEIPTAPPSPGNTSRNDAGFVLLLLVMVGGVLGVIFGIGAIQHLIHPHVKAFTPWPASIWVAVPALLVLALIGFAWYRARTQMFTAPHQAAPTFWERNRATITITAVFSALSLVVGWLIGQA